MKAKHLGGEPQSMKKAICFPKSPAVWINGGWYFHAKRAPVKDIPEGFEESKSDTIYSEVFFFAFSHL